MKHLGIVIPTFERPIQLRETVRRLLPQIDEKCEIVVLDNRSSKSIDLSDLICDEKTPQVRKITNWANIGAVGNVLRSLEVVECRWLWILADDDEVLPDAIATITSMTEEIGANQEASTAFISYSSELGQREEDCHVQGRYQFAKAVEKHLSSALLISSLILNRSVCRAHVRHGYDFALAMAPHLAIIISAMEPKIGGLFSKRRIIRWKQAPEENRWSILIFQARLPLLLEHPSLDSVSQKHLAIAIQNTLEPLHVTALRVAYRIQSGDDNLRLRRLFAEICSRYASIRQPFHLRLWGKVFSCSLLFPKTLFKIANVWYKYVRCIDIQKALSTNAETHRT